MSVPYGAPQQQPGPAQQPVGVNLNFILPLVGAGLGLIAYLLAFADDVSTASIDLLLAAGVLSGLSVLPKMPRLLPAAAVLTAVPTLLFLQGMIKSEADTKGMQIVLLLVALLETAAVVASLLLDAGVLKLEPKPANPYGQPGGWNPQSGGFPQPGQQPPHQQQQPGQFNPPSGQFGSPVQPQQQQPGAPQPTSYMPQPGQFNQPGQQPGTPPGGFGQQPQG
ncbi:hypothetical protein GCM10010492_41030 [Saccharothrix mutabilis subsp. mutabilis]|uniref:34 kDa antigenic protein n=1 Tax=Saccharothrix mutabilis subsp. mutabilis TaxID=66855 RepID=A0ABP3DSP5_9PSEU